jgi:hypothetical protein
LHHQFVVLPQASRTREAWGFFSFRHDCVRGGDIVEEAQLANDSRPLTRLQDVAVLGAGASNLLCAFFWLRAARASDS